jgi:secondary thiamine-phosphate synthase enzyme
VVKAHKETLNIATKKRIQLTDLTSQVQAIVGRAKIKDGLLSLYVNHTTCGILMNENEAGLKTDIERTLEKLFPKGGEYLHNRVDNNADAHLKAIFVGNSRTLPVTGGVLHLGMWQSIFFAEFDGPRNRTLTLMVIGE